MTFDIIALACVRREGERRLRALSLTTDAENPTLEIDGVRAKVFDGKYWMDEPETSREVTFTLISGGERATLKKTIVPAKKWTVHIIQSSHCDRGYTTLPARSEDLHARSITSALDQLDERADYPDDARPRVSLESFWPVEAFLRTAAPETKQRFIKAVQTGDIEILGMYGNMVTEMLGHEEIYRALYTANAFVQKAGVRLAAAAHNDVPAMSWGFCQALCDAGIQFFAPLLPKYYGWGQSGLHSFWDEKRVLGYEGKGGFWWEAPNGKRLLTWCDNDNCRSTEFDPDAILLSICEMEAHGWPCEVLHWDALGAAIDNSPYKPIYADGVKAWNEQYESPHLVMSTQERFYRALTSAYPDLDKRLPVWRGEIPGQDFPAGATSRAPATAAARATHAVLAAAEKLAAFAANDPFLTIDSDDIREAYRSLLLADEHTFGFHFPAGASAVESQYEKDTFAYRARALAEDILDRAMASVADRVKKVSGEYALTVFNLAGEAGNLAVEMPLHEIENCTRVMRPANSDPSILKGYSLNNRMHVPPEKWMWEQGFKLVDAQTGELIPHEMRRLSWDDPEPFASQRAGLAQGTRRYGIFEFPDSLGWTARFSLNVPAYGYRTLAVVRAEHVDTKESEKRAQESGSIENEFYRLVFDRRGVLSLTDKRDGFEMLDSTCPHNLGTLILRDKRDQIIDESRATQMQTLKSDVCEALEITASLGGTFLIRERIELFAGVDEVRIALRVIKSPEPAQSIFAAFPFVGDGTRYQGVLCDCTPGRDVLPGAQSDFNTVGDWALAKGSEILLSARDTSVLSLSGLHKGYVSPAHSIYFVPEPHPPLTEQDFDKGWMYALITMNAFGTNKMVSQLSDVLTRFVIRRTRDTSDAALALTGERMMLGTVTMLTDRSRGELPYSGVFCQPEGAQLLTWKRAENGNGYIARFWNHTDMPVRAALTVGGTLLTNGVPCDALEHPLPEGDGLVPAHGIATIWFDF